MRIVRSSLPLAARVPSRENAIALTVAGVPLKRRFPLGVSLGGRQVA